MVPIHDDQFRIGDRVKVNSGEFAGCRGVVKTQRRCFLSGYGLVFGYAVLLDAAVCWRCVSEQEISRMDDPAIQPYTGPHTEE